MPSDSSDSAGMIHALCSFDLKNGADSHVVVGIDEAGRGPLAGPVVAAAVCFDYSKALPPVNDSKKLSEKKREILYGEILSSAVGWGVGIIEHTEIDTINILQATFKAMESAVMSLQCSWDRLLIDGNRTVPGLPCEVQTAVVKGDGKSAAIAAASIIAKVTRDRLMVEYDEIFPGYGFSKHKGYGTKAHCEYIKKYGLSSIHRKSFCSMIVAQTELAL